MCIFLFNQQIMMFESLVQYLAKIRSLVFKKLQSKKWTVGIFVKCISLNRFTKFLLQMFGLLECLMKARSL